MDSITNEPPVIQMMDCCKTGNKQLSEPMKAYFTDFYAHYRTRVMDNLG